MPRYNLVLLPQNEAAVAQLLKEAHAQFGALAEGYLLGSGALPHVTLCQFQAPSAPKACDLWKMFSFPSAFFLKLLAFHFRKGTKEHEGFFWAEYLTDRPKLLMECQKEAVALIEKEGAVPLTSSAAYAPHLTLARVRQAGAPLVVEDALLDPICFRCAVGASTENGALTEILQAQTS